eukprot:m.197721 g.197721  ORF g.197721 m.197721 type:complete len:1262 (+) comp17025_c0_seq3:219-4004(+)
MATNFQSTGIHLNDTTIHRDNQTNKPSQPSTIQSLILVDTLSSFDVWPTSRDGPDHSASMASTPDTVVALSDAEACDPPVEEAATVAVGDVHVQAEAAVSIRVQAEAEVGGRPPESEQQDTVPPLLAIPSSPTLRSLARNTPINQGLPTPPTLSRSGSGFDPSRRRSVSLTTSAAEAQQLLAIAQEQQQQLLLASHPEVIRHTAMLDRLANKAERKASEGAFTPQHGPLRSQSLCPQALPDRTAAPLNRLTSYLRTTHGAIQASAPAQVKRLARAPFRCLNGESVERADNGIDDADGNLIVHIRDELVDNHGRTLTVLDLLGTGTYGQVFKARRQLTQDLVALKVIKNREAYTRQSRMEVTALQHIATTHNNAPERLKNLVTLLQNFEYNSHFCTVYELCGPSLYDLLKRRGLRGLPLARVKHYTQQLLLGLTAIHEAGICHADLKPENILVNEHPKNSRLDVVKIIDFGSAFTTSTKHYYSYMQSRFYRAPETLLGLLKQGSNQRQFDFGTPMDIWSTACVAVELFIGRPLFCGSCHWDHLRHFHKLLGPFPPHMLEHGHLTSCFYRISSRTKTYRLRYYDEMKSMRDKKTKLHSPAASPRTRFGIATLNDVMSQNKADLSSYEDRRAFVSFLKGVFEYDPAKRLTAHQALKQTFLLDKDAPTPTMAPPKAADHVRPVLAREPPVADPVRGSPEAVTPGSPQLRQPRPGQSKTRAVSPKPPLLTVRSPSGNKGFPKVSPTKPKPAALTKARNQRVRAHSTGLKASSKAALLTPAAALPMSAQSATKPPLKRAISRKSVSMDDETQREVERLQTFLRAPPSPALSDISVASSTASARSSVTWEDSKGDSKGQRRSRLRMSTSTADEATSSSSASEATASGSQGRLSTAQYRLSVAADWQESESPSTVQMPVYDEKGNLMYLVPSQQAGSLSHSSSNASLDLPEGMVAGDDIGDDVLDTLNDTVVPASFPPPVMATTPSSLSAATPVASLSDQRQSTASIDTGLGGSGNFREGMGQPFHNMPPVPGLGHGQVDPRARQSVPAVPTAASTHTYEQAASRVYQQPPLVMQQHPGPMQTQYHQAAQAPYQQSVPLSPYHHVGHGRPPQAYHHHPLQGPFPPAHVTPAHPQLPTPQTPEDMARQLAYLQQAQQHGLQAYRQWQHTGAPPPPAMMAQPLTYPAHPQYYAQASAHATPAASMARSLEASPQHYPHSQHASNTFPSSEQRSSGELALQAPDQARSHASDQARSHGSNESTSSTVKTSDV